MACIGIVYLGEVWFIFFKIVQIVLWHHSKKLLPTLQGHHAFLLRFQVEMFPFSIRAGF